VKKPNFKLTKGQFDSLATDSIAKWGMQLSFIVLGFNILLLVVTGYRLPPEVPLLYSRPYGQSQLVPSWGLWMLLGLMALISLTCFRIASSLLEKERLLAQVLVWTGCLVTIMGCITLIKTILLVI